MMVSGKVLITIKDHTSCDPIIDVKVFSTNPKSNAPYIKDSLIDALHSILRIDGVSTILSNRQQKLPDFSTIRIKATVVVEYVKTFDGDYDLFLEYKKIKTLREQSPNKKITKKYIFNIKNKSK